MKYLVLMAVLMPFLAFAQTEGIINPEKDSLPQWTYCRIVGTERFMNPDKVVVSIDFGQAADRNNFWGVNDQRIRDEKGKVADFNSMIDALNYMGDRGWEFVQAYTVTYGNSNVYHWLLKADKRKQVFIPSTKKKE